MSIRLTVILPTYNKRANIVALVERLERALEGTGHELLFVDDSTDGTDTEIEGQARRCPPIVLVYRRNRSGSATAVIEGIGRGVLYLVSNLIGIGPAAVWDFKINNGRTWRLSPSPLAETVIGSLPLDTEDADGFRCAPELKPQREASRS